MENLRIFRPISISLLQFPTLVLIVGYASYWFELLILKHHSYQTTGLATAIAVLVAAYIIVRNDILSEIKLKGLFFEFLKSDFVSRIFLIAGVVLSSVILAVGLYAALLPPHLVQEFDALNYHITLVRQHLLLGSFDPISWSSADLFLLPLDFALAPYWLVSELPSKLVQYIFAIGLLARTYSLVMRVTDCNRTSALTAVFLILGMQLFGIQLGTAMLDIVMCYLVVAAIDSFLRGNFILSTWEFGFYFWSKPFVPLQSILIIVLLIVIYGVIRLAKGDFFVYMGLNECVLKVGGLKEFLKKFLIPFLLISIFIAGPFIFKSLKYTGTPLYPFFTGQIVIDNYVFEDLSHWQLIVDKAKEFLSVKDWYGYGRSFPSFIKHFWLIAVPEHGVNNAYDYPVGLPYLICFFPFLIVFVCQIIRRRFELIPWFVVLFWGTWWMGCQQSRFLFVALILLLIVVAARKEFSTTPFKIAVLLSLILTVLSIVRAHKADWGKWGYEALRTKDKELIEMSQAHKEPMPLEINFVDAAFATVPITVKHVDSNSTFILE